MEEKKIRKIGRLTFGVTLVLLGILVMLATFLPIDVLRFGFAFGPIIFISIGFEIIYYSRKDDINIKYDVIGIILTFIMILIAGLFSIGNYFVNKILYSDELKQEISESIKNEDMMFDFFEESVNLNNLSSIPVNLNIIENSSYKEPLVSVHVNYKNKDIGIISSIINNDYDVYNYFRPSYSSDTLTIIDNDNIESANITVLINSKENIKTSGNFNIK